MAIKKDKKDKLQTTSFSLSQETRVMYEKLFKKMGLDSWANGVRFALSEFYRAHQDITREL